MNTFIHTSVACYLIGCFISAGIAFGMKKQDESWGETFGFAIFLGILSWINVGIIIGDLYTMYIKAQEEPGKKE